MRHRGSKDGKVTLNVIAMLAIAPDNRVSDDLGCRQYLLNSRVEAGGRQDVTLSSLLRRQANCTGIRFRPSDNDAASYATAGYLCTPACLS